jgi:large subunit ribosomal protein L21
MAYAIFKTGGKQYRVQEGDTISVDKLPVSADDEVKFPEVLLVNDGENTKVGAPIIDGAGVTAKVIEQHRGKKGRCLQVQASQRFPQNHWFPSSSHQASDHRDRRLNFIKPPTTF